MRWSRWELIVAALLCTLGSSLAWRLVVRVSPEPPSGVRVIRRRGGHEVAVVVDAPYPDITLLRPSEVQSWLEESSGQTTPTSF